MSNIPVVDASLALQQGLQGDPVQRKLDMDALRSRLGDTASKQQKLREACEGFEAVFLQKMWEQMRKNVPKEGYLHSKDEETYQSLFDVELSKKMAGAGGIGLADMLYAQLAQQLEDTGRTTTPSSYRSPLSIAPSDTLMAAAPVTPPRAAAAAPAGAKPLTAEELYSPLADESEPLPGALPANALESALRELQAELGTAQDASPGTPAAEWAAERALANGTALLAERNKAKAATPVRPTVQSTAEATVEAARAEGPAEGSTPGMPGPAHIFGKSRNTVQAQSKPAAQAAPAQPRGMVPSETLWPLAAESGTVTSRFGWEDEPGGGRRRWNAGVRIDAAPGTPVRAVLPGTVVYAGERDGYGNTVVIEHKDGYRSYYSNLSENTVKIGDKVKHGAEFAKIAAQPPASGNGENSASLHFELKKGEMALNPESAIRRPNAAQG